MHLAESADAPALFKLSLSFLNDRSLQFNSEVPDNPDVNRITLRFRSFADDGYYGMGERYDSAEHRGKRVHVWTEEQHVGLGWMSDAVGDKPWNPLPRGPSTYFPVPFFLNPRGYGFLLDDTHYSEFDFGKTEPNVLAITNWNSRFDFILFYGPAPLEVIEAQTAYTGRVTPAPPWAFGVWNAAAQGSNRVREVAAITRQERIPTSAIWSEDWAWPGNSFFSFAKGTLQWDLNRDRYPDYELVGEELHQDGFRFLGYFMPYLGPKSEAFENASEWDYLVKDANGLPYIFRWCVITKMAQVDLTNPEAGDWWKDAFFQKAVEYGQDGWMHDFSEYTPADSIAFDSRQGWETHNEYPLLWAKLGREFWDEMRPDGDYVFFMRAGYTGLQQYASVMWTGDQNMDWEKYDGIPSVIPAMNSVGISGFPVTATDIAGYHCIVFVPPTDKELFFRWTQLGALLPVMRIHESSGCEGNWLFDSDEQTLNHWKKYAEFHVSLFPYIYTLVHEAAQKGWPVARHLMLHYWNDPGSKTEEYEFLLGDRMLVAPVIQDGAREREVYFPPGEWIDFWRGDRFFGPGKKIVPAPLDTIPLFVKSGTLIPAFDSQIDTLVEEDRGDLNGWDDANGSIRVLFFGEGGLRRIHAMGWHAFFLRKRYGELHGGKLAFTQRLFFRVPIDTGKRCDGP